MSGGMEEMAEWEQEVKNATGADLARLHWYEAEHLRNQKESNREESITLAVIKDLKEREQFGALKYGKFLTHHSNEDMMQHLYEELLDAALYIKTEMKKRNNVANIT
jgi:MarR-like DNA-binding transcriptional regulator SgrR of sgrS sRNA